MGLLETPRTNVAAPPPDPAAIERVRAAQAEIADAWERGRAERAAVIATGPALSDPAAAADCRCSCHPRPAEPTLHDRGVSCPCQLSDDEARARRVAALERLQAAFVDDGVDEVIARERDEFAATADALGVAATCTGFACPVTVSGTVDGCAFAARERHDTYRVVVDPTGDIDDLHTWSPGALLVAAGSVDEFDRWTPATLLTVAVTATRTHLRRIGCAHGRNPDGAVFCCDCGVALDTLDGPAPTV
jgi:hypothetical protein